jgi:hypothetical protein
MSIDVIRNCICWIRWMEYLKFAGQLKCIASEQKLQLKKKQENAMYIFSFDLGSCK